MYIIFIVNMPTYMFAKISQFSFCYSVFLRLALIEQVLLAYNWPNLHVLVLILEKGSSPHMQHSKHVLLIHHRTSGHNHYTYTSCEAYQPSGRRDHAADSKRKSPWNWKNVIKCRNKAFQNKKENQSNQKNTEKIQKHTPRSKNCNFVLIPMICMYLQKRTPSWPT